MKHSQGLKVELRQICTHPFFGRAELHTGKFAGVLHLSGAGLFFFCLHNRVFTFLSYLMNDLMGEDLFFSDGKILLEGLQG